MTCKRCVVRNYKKKMKNFLSFCAEYEDSIEQEEKTLLFQSRTDRLEWRVSRHKKIQALYQEFLGRDTQQGASLEEQLCNNFRVGKETYGFATSIFGCSARPHNPHTFRIEADTVGAAQLKKLHGNARGKRYALNYQMAAAMQQMGVGMTAMQTLCGFLDLPTSASCHHHIKQAEAVGGPVQIALQKKVRRRQFQKRLK